VRSEGDLGDGPHGAAATGAHKPVRPPQGARTIRNEEILSACDDLFQRDDRAFDRALEAHFRDELCESLQKWLILDRTHSTPARATELASKIKGVKAVHNNLKVDSK